MDSITKTVEYDHKRIPWGAEIAFPNSRTFAQLTHRVFNRYPARSISLVPRAIIRATTKPKGRRVRVLDPFMGSGTTAVEAAIAGCSAFGVEIDPLARMITEVRVRRYSDDQVKALKSIYDNVATRWMSSRIETSLRPQLQNVEHWFDNSTFEDLLRIKTVIYQETNNDNITRDFMRVVLADMIRPCSLVERQTLKPYISKKFKKTPAPVDLAFEKSFSSHLKAIEEFTTSIPNHFSPSLEWLGCDAASFSSGDQRMDVAITSPPYTNALDYVRCIKIESAWVDCGKDETFSALRKGQIGDPARKRDVVDDIVRKHVGALFDRILSADAQRGLTVLGYFDDICQNLRCTYRALRRGGDYHMIIGDSVIRGVEVPTHEIIAAIAGDLGFRWKQYYRYRIRDHRTSIPRKNQGGKIKYEFVVSLRKP